MGAQGVKQQARSVLARANRSLGRRTGFKIAPAPIDGTLNAELARLLAGCKIVDVIDVGAHRGRFADRLRSSLGYNGRIVSFEPSVAAFEVLAAQAHTDEGWTVQQLALGASEGQMTLHEFEGNDELNSLRELSEYAETYSPGLSPTDMTTVEVRRLDSLWADLSCDGPRTLLKIDTQGYDLEVIEGAGSILDDIPSVLMEVGVNPLYAGAPRPHEVLARMDDKGFELTGAFPIHRYAGGLRVIEFDCTFVNRRRFDGTQA